MDFMHGGSADVVKKYWPYALGAGLLIGGYLYFTSSSTSSGASSGTSSTSSTSGTSALSLTPAQQLQAQATTMAYQTKMQGLQNQAQATAYSAASSMMTTGAALQTGLAATSAQVAMAKIASQSAATQGQNLVAIAALGSVNKINSNATQLQMYQSAQNAATVQNANTNLAKVYVASQQAQAQMVQSYSQASATSSAAYDSYLAKYAAVGMKSQALASFAKSAAFLQSQNAMAAQASGGNPSRLSFNPNLFSGSGLSTSIG